MSPQNIKGRVKEVPVTEITRAVLIAIRKVNGDSLKAHAELDAYLGRLPHQLKRDGKKEFKKFLAAGLVRKHRTNTFSWTVEGLEAARAVSSNTRPVTDHLVRWSIVLSPRTHTQDYKGRNRMFTGGLLPLFFPFYPSQF